MPTLYIKVLIFVFGSVGSALGQTFTSSVVQLTDTNFKESTSEKDVFIIYHQTWCTHSNVLIPYWNILADRIGSEEESQLKIASMDCRGSKICFEKRMNSFPTMMLHRKNGTEFKFTGKRSVPLFIKFLNEKLELTMPEKKQVEENTTEANGGLKEN